MSDDPQRLRPASISPWAKVTALTPYLWLIAFFLVPFLIVLKISLSQTAIAQPPYLPVLDIAAGWRGREEFVAGLSFANYATIAGDALSVYLRQSRPSPALGGSRSSQHRPHPALRCAGAAVLASDKVYA